MASVLLEEQWTPELNENGSSSFSEINPSTVRPVASYSWLAKSLDFPKPTILVPGCPRIWKRRPYPFTIRPDKGTEYGDCNVAELPSCPLLPLFLSVQLMEPEFKFESMDVISDKSALRNMLRWVQVDRLAGISDFSIEAELLGGDKETLVLVQPGADHKYDVGLYRKNLELEHSSLPPGWGKTFGHYRIVTYELGDMKMLVRFPVDVCDPQMENDPSKSLTLPNSHPVVETSGGQLNYIRHPGKLAFQNAMVELVVRQTNRVVDWDWVWHQLYFSWTQKLFVVNHIGGQVNGLNQEFLTRTGGLRNAVEKSRKDLRNVELLLDLIRQYLKNFTEQKNNLKQKSSTGVKLRFDFFKNERHLKVYQLSSPSNIPSLDKLK